MLFTEVMMIHEEKLSKFLEFILYEMIERQGFYMIPKKARHLLEWRADFL